MLHGQIIDRGEAGAEIIKRDQQAEILQLPDRGHVGFLVFQKRSLGDLKLQPFGLSIIRIMARRMKAATSSTGARPTGAVRTALPIIYQPSAR